uniref:protein STPG4-like isoform X1 n=1 Tax=Ciona intestinalis TaxID=7719 RepID=UPI000180BEB9|nr:protein STPG4-like isoform X1 [Ciona intestinalis]|eukprot:XP_018667244.1 protein STPG4-like isoform X1 [Ciona intestinalis]
MLKMPAASMLARKHSRAVFRLPPTRSSITLRELRTLPRRGRNTPHDIFTPQLTDREWWRVTLKETPVPGTYEQRDFLQDKDLNRIKPTYNFKGEGRKKNSSNTRNGEILLPGAYEHKDFLEELSRQPLTYEFKSSGRRRVLPGLKDRDCNVAPCEYETLRIPVNKAPIHHGAFKSQSPRFPTKYFNPKEGPPPGSYDPTNINRSPSVTSSFKSRTPRFRTSQTKVPGPATYASTLQTPQSQTVMKMGRMHGLFFRNSFEV